MTSPTSPEVRRAIARVMVTVADRTGEPVEDHYYYSVGRTPPRLLPPEPPEPRWRRLWGLLPLPARRNRARYPLPARKPWA
ncbi:hypothetical protein [Corynebacterium mastitidis]